MALTLVCRWNDSQHLKYYEYYSYEWAAEELWEPRAGWSVQRLREVGVLPSTTVLTRPHAERMSSSVIQMIP